MFVASSGLYSFNTYFEINGNLTHTTVLETGEAGDIYISGNHFKFETFCKKNQIRTDARHNQD